MAVYVYAHVLTIFPFFITFFLVMLRFFNDATRRVEFFFFNVCRTRRLLRAKRSNRILVFLTCAGQGGNCTRSYRESNSPPASGGHAAYRFIYVCVLAVLALLLCIMFVLVLLVVLLLCMCAHTTVCRLL